MTSSNESRHQEDNRKFLIEIHGVTNVALDAIGSELTKLKHPFSASDMDTAGALRSKLPSGH
jgi:hypothetical protein